MWAMSGQVEPFGYDPKHRTRDYKLQRYFCTQYAQFFQSSQHYRNGDGPAAAVLTVYTRILYLAVAPLRKYVA